MTGLIRTTDDFESLLRRIGSASALVLDVETSGLDWKRNSPVGYVFSFSANPDDSFYLPIRHGGGGNFLDLPPLEEAESEIWPRPSEFEASLFRAIRDNPSCEVVGHNLSFDLLFCSKMGMEIPENVQCTMTTAATLNENAKAYSLQACCGRADVQAKKTEEIQAHLAKQLGVKADRNAMGSFWRLAGDDPGAVDYATGDGVSTWQLYEKYQRGIQAQELDRILRLEKRVTVLLTEMTRFGIRIDTDRLEETVSLLRVKLDGLVGRLGGANIRSTSQMEAVLRRQGVTEFPKTDAGRTSITEKWLNTIEPGRAIVEARKLRTLIDSFLVPLAQEHLFRGRVHPSFNQLKGDDHGVVTGRLSSSQPNAQAIPKRDKVQGKLFRRLFLPDAGAYWHTRDYSQQEYRNVAHYSGCEAILDGYRRGVDFHSLVADDLGIDREAAKRLNLGLIYQMGAAKLAAAIGVDVATAEQYRDGYRRKYPEAISFMRTATVVAERRGYVRSIWGRRRRFPDHQFCSKAGNAIIQMSSADQTKRAMVNCRDYLHSVGGGRVALQVHDNLDFFINDPGHEPELNRIMCDHGPDSDMPLNVPVRTDCGSGPNYAMATYGDDEVEEDPC